MDAPQAPAPIAHDTRPPILPRIARVLFVAGGLAPWLVAPLRAWLPLGAIGAAIDAIFVPMCHRMPERTLAIAGVAMPLCSRCAGVFAGAALGALVARPKLDGRRWRLLLAAACVPVLIDVATQDLGVHSIWHTTRIATGLVLGYAIGAACITALDRDARRAG